MTGNAIAGNPAQAAQAIAAVVLQGLMASHVQATQNAHQVIVEIVFAATPGKTAVILTQTAGEVVLAGVAARGIAINAIL